MARRGAFFGTEISPSVFHPVLWPEPAQGSWPNPAQKAFGHISILV
jgi:hypothetical protein